MTDLPRYKIDVFYGVVNSSGCEVNEGWVKWADVSSRLQQLAQEKKEMLDALRLAQRWLANSIPVVDLDGPKPLPVIAAVLEKAEGR